MGGSPRRHNLRRRRAALAVALATVAAAALASACLIAVPDVVLGVGVDGSAGDSGADARLEGDGALSGPDGAHPPPDGGVTSCVDGSAGDPRNCGACGHDCQGGACSGGVCQPFALQPSLAGAYRLAVDDSSVFWTDGTSNGVFRGGKSTVGGAVTLALGASQGASMPQAIVVDATNVYWSNAETSGGSIYRCPKTGCPASGPVRVASGLAEPTDLALDGADLYFVERTGGTVKRVSTGAVDGTPAVIASGLTSPEGLLVDAASARVFWTDSATATSHVASIAKVGAAGGFSPTVFASGLARPYMLAQTPTALVWTNEGPPFLGAKGSVEGRPRPGSADAGAFAQAGTTPYFVAASGSEIFWTDRGAPAQDPTGFVYPNGTVRTCAVADCARPEATRVIAIQQAEVQGVAVTADAVYWATSGLGATAGTVMKVVRGAK